MKKLPWLLVLVVVAACGKDETPSPSTSTLSGELDLDIRDKASVSIDAEGTSTKVTVSVSKGFGVLPENTPVTGPGSIEAIPETDGTLYTGRLSGPVVPGGRCGDQPVSIGFSLQRDESNARVSGGMAAYCGAAVWHGTPVRMLRLSGSMNP
jgi:hypothetical protein